MSRDDRLPCQVCGRWLTTRRDGLTKPHKAPGSRDEPHDYCVGTGYRHARWEVGQMLRHHAGDRWLVEANIGGTWGDYRIRCVAGREAGRVMVAHGEYMHRHGWTPIEAAVPA